MATITLTVANVRPLNGAVVRRYDAGEALSCGHGVIVASDGDVEKVASASAADVWMIGIVAACPDGDTSAASGEPVDVVVRGPITGYSGMTPGALVYPGVTAGALATGAGTATAIGGYSESATIIFVRPELITLA